MWHGATAVAQCSAVVTTVRFNKTNAAKLLKKPLQQLKAAVLLRGDGATHPPSLVQSDCTLWHVLIASAAALLLAAAVEARPHAMSRWIAQ
jgi:hypothetical protein